MRVIASKGNKPMYLETNKAPEIVTDQFGLKYYYVQLPPIDEIFRLIPTPLLEDLFAETRVELMERDKRSIPEAI